MKSYRTKTVAQKQKLRVATNKVFRLFDSGAQMARLLGTSRQVVHNWKQRGVIPTHYLSQVSQLTEIPAEEIRPDLFL